MKAIMILGAVLIMIGMKTAAADSEWLENLTAVFIISGIAVGLVGVLAGHSSNEGARLMNERLPAIWKKGRKYQDLLNSISAVPRADGNQNLPPEHYLVKLDAKKFEPLYDKCLRALYFTKYQKVYPPEYSFDFFYPKHLKGIHKDFVETLHTRNVGSNDVFYCGVAHTKESEDVFGALLIFYQRFAVVGMTSNLNKFDPDNK